MCKIFIISLLSLFINSFATAQSVVPSVIMGRDTVPHVLLHEVDVVARLKNPRKYARQQQRNQRMVYNVRKVFPYAKIAAAKINEIENKLAQTPATIYAHTLRFTLPIVSSSPTCNNTGSFIPIMLPFRSVPFVELRSST